MILPRRLKLPLVLLALLSGLSGFQWVLGALRSENITRKDFIQEYLMARAIRSGVNPYLPLPELNDRFQTGAQLAFPHPTPHTPVVGVFSLPFAFLGYAQAAGVWLLVEILCLCASVFLLLRQFIPSSSLLLASLVAWAALGWSHVWEGLAVGQLNTILLLLLVGAWLNMRNDKLLPGAAMLGVAISFKLIFWPIVLFLAFRRRWRGAVVAIAVFIGANLIAAMVIGWRVVADYFVHYGPSTATLYRACSQNLSLWSVGWRVFLGTGSPTLAGIDAPPLFYSPRLALGVSLVLTGAALVLGVAAALKVDRKSDTDARGNFDLAFWIMVCICLLVSPLTWPHYLILTALPASLVMQRLRALRFPRAETLLYAVAVVLLLVPDLTLESFILSFSSAASRVHNNLDILPDMRVSFGAGLLRLIPTLGMSILVWLMRQLSRMSDNRSLSPK
jgi:hypothetical protein